MEAITITLDGREVSGNRGRTVLELARESGVEIPTLCHDPRLSSIGACRICLVEEERTGRLLASCATPIEPGMVINTTSPRVMERRRAIVKLMLASHPDSCLVCDKGNCCELRRIAAEAGVGLVDLDRVPQPAVIQEVNPFIERDHSKCILCAKCIRVDHEIVVQGAIDYIHRGFASKPATLDDMPLEGSDCAFCGNCVSVCPTGALMEKHRAYGGIAPKTVSTTCPFCGCGCEIDLEVKDDRIVRSRPSEKGRLNGGALCAKGSYGYDFVHSPERLTSPLVRRDDGFVEVDWNEALELAASRLSAIRDEHGSSALAVIGSSTCTNEEAYLLQRFARFVLGTNNLDNSSRLHGIPAYIGLSETIGIPGTTSPMDRIERSDALLVVGANLPSSSPALSYAVKRAVKYGGSKLILVDPLQTGLSPFARLLLKPRVGTDPALINGLAHVIVDESLFDDEFVARKTDHFEAFSESLKPYTPEYVEEVTGVPRDEIRHAARVFSQASQGSIIYGSGVTQQVTGTESVIALANLAMLTGNVGLRGGIYVAQRDCNGQGVCDMGALPDVFPGYRRVDHAASREYFLNIWGSPVPADAGLTATEMMRGASEGRVKGMYIVGEDLVASLPQSGRTREALGSLDFLLVSEMFLTETAKAAHVVLPAASFAEKEGTFTNFEGRVRHLQSAIAPIGASLSDWTIILRLAAQMGQPLPFSSLPDVMDEIERTIPLYQGIGYRDANAREPYGTELYSDSMKTRRLYDGQFPSGFGRFSPVEFEPPEPAEDGYPLVLIAGTILYHAGRGSWTSMSPRLSRFAQGGYLEICEADAVKAGAKEGEEVKIVSREGSASARVRISERVPRGTVFMPVCFPSAPVNDLFDSALDTRSKTPATRACMVRLERT